MAVVVLLEGVLQLVNVSFNGIKISDYNISNFLTAVCDELEEIENGTISYSTDMTAPYSVGTVATYSCNSGYELSTTRDQMRTCEDGGSAGASFNGEAPTCERKFSQDISNFPSVINLHYSCL